MASGGIEGEANRTAIGLGDRVETIGEVIGVGGSGGGGGAR